MQGSLISWTPGISFCCAMYSQSQECLFSSSFSKIALYAKMWSWLTNSNCLRYRKSACVWCKYFTSTNLRQDEAVDTRNWACPKQAGSSGRTDGRTYPACNPVRAMIEFASCTIDEVRPTTTRSFHLFNWRSPGRSVAVKTVPRRLRSRWPTAPSQLRPNHFNAGQSMSDRQL